MSNFRQTMTTGRRWLLGEKGFVLLMFVLGAFFTALGIHRFCVRPEHFGLTSLLGCVVGAFGAFFLLLISDYVFHHAFLVFIPWSIALVYFAIIQPHFAVGLGIAWWCMVVSQLKT